MLLGDLTMYVAGTVHVMWPHGDVAVHLEVTDLVNSV